MVEADVAEGVAGGGVDGDPVVVADGGELGAGSTIGGVLLAIVGALVAIPVAAAIRLLLQEIAFRRLDKS